MGLFYQILLYYLTHLYVSFSLFLDPVLHNTALILQFYPQFSRLAFSNWVNVRPTRPLFKMMLVVQVIYIYWCFLKIMICQLGGMFEIENKMVAPVVAPAFAMPTNTDQLIQPSTMSV